MSQRDAPSDCPADVDPVVAAVRLPDDTPGSSRYRPVRLHARGSLGEVHVARDEELNREVALKELQDHCADHHDSRLRFLREAEITAALEHPCIVPVYGRGRHADGRPYYAMRLVRGESLEESIRRHHDPESAADPAARSLAFRDLLTRFVAVCQAVAYAHSRGVIHRDLKPGNVMLGPFGETLVVDWGLARHFDRPDGAPLSDEPLPASPVASSTATQAGQVVGTPAYMSPEQAAGRKDLGPATDVYSLGGILYSILTGQPPLVRALAPMLLLRGDVDRTPPAPRLLNRAVPGGLEAVCLKAMAQAPEGRYRSADELAREVQRWLADEPVRALPDPLPERWRRWSRRHRSVVAGLAALLLTAVVGLGIGLAAVSREQARTAEQRDAALDAERKAEVNRALAQEAHDRAEQNVRATRRALGEVKRSLEQADRNLHLARKAIDQTFVLTTSEPLLRHESAAAFRRRLMQATLPYYREFSSLKPDDPAFDLDLARNLTRVGTIESQIGERDEARGHAERARKLCDGVARRKLTADESQELADCLNNIGSIYHAIGELNEAVAVLTEGRALQERLVKDRPNSFRARLHLCRMTYNLGLIETTRKRAEPALSWLDQSLALETALLQKHPDNTDLLGAHVGTWRTKAGLLQSEKWLDEAHQAYAKGGAAADRLLKHPKVNPDHVRSAATTYSDHAALRSNQGKPAEALPLFLKAIGLQESLCRQHPEVLFCHDLAIMTSNLGRVCLLLRKPDEELAAWEKARRTWAELAARRPKEEAFRKGNREAAQQVARARVARIDRLIAAGDSAAAARETERLAAEAHLFEPALVAYAAACGRWLNGFAKDDRVSEAQRDEMVKRALALLEQARREGMLAGKSALLRDEKSFESLRHTEAFKKLLGGLTREL